MKRILPAILLAFLATFPLRGESQPIERTDQKQSPVVSLENLKWSVAKGIHTDLTGVETKTVETYPILPVPLFQEEVSARIHYYTLKTTFTITEEQLTRLTHPALSIAGIGERWEIYLNGKRIAGSLVAGAKAVELTEADLSSLPFPNPEYTRYLVIPVEPGMLGNENELTVYVSGYAPATFLATNQLLGFSVAQGYSLSNQSYYEKQHESYIEITLYGVYLFFGLYHAFLFLKRRQTYYNLYFAAFSVMLSVHLLAYTYPVYQSVQNSAYIMFAGYISQPFALGFFLLFLQSYFYQDNKIPKPLFAALAANAVAALFILVMPYRFYQTALFAWYILALPQALYIVYFVISILRKSLPDAWALSAGLFAGLVSVVWDIIDSVYFHTQIRMIPVGQLIFILVLVGIQATRFSRVHNEAESLAHELEERVKRRTNELERAWNDLEIAYREAEQSRKVVTKLSEFNRQLNQTNNYDEVVIHIFDYIESNFEIEGVWLFHIDTGTDEFYLSKTSAASLLHYDQKTIEREKNKRFKISDNRIIESIIQKKRPSYLRRLKRNPEADEIEQIAVGALQIQSLLMIPTLIYGNVHSIVAFTKYNEDMKLSRDNIRAINQFCSQIAGVLHTASLFKQVEQERKNSDSLLENVLPPVIARELKDKGRVVPRKHESVTILFTDFKAFTKEAERMPAEELLEDLDAVFEQFDQVCTKYGIEKLKTIGDSYMAAGGLTNQNPAHPIDVCLAAIDIMDFVKQVNIVRRDITGGSFWQMRIGIHTGPVIAGIIGRTRFAYDIWGDAVNVASRMESASEPGRINISAATHEHVQYFFQSEHRGDIPVKNHGPMSMYYLNGIRPSLSAKHVGVIPDERFFELYNHVKAGKKIRFASKDSK